MKSNKWLGGMAAMLALVTTAIAGCSSDDPLLQYLGFVDGPTQGDTITAMNNTCHSNCDGQIDDLTASVSNEKLIVEPFFTDIDDDLTALIESILWVPMSSAGTQNLFDELENRFNELYPEGLEGETPYGPWAGSYTLEDVCESGSAQVLYVSQGSIAPPPMKGGIGFVYLEWLDNYYATFSNCQIVGDIDGNMGDEEVTLNGNVHIRDTVLDNNTESRVWTIAIEGLVTVNPGASAPAPSGPSEPDLIWGYDEPLSIDAEAEYMTSASGGFCYGGTTPTSEGCDGLFVPMSDDETLHDMLFYYWTP